MTKRTATTNRTCDANDENTDTERNDNHLRSVVKIECSRNEGTAICIHSSDGVGHIFLTCAHVVQHKTQSVILRHDGRVIKGAVIYATNKNVPHDIAVIVTGRTADITPCTISDTIPTVGQKVCAVGYAFKENVPSTVFGHVHRTSFSVLTTTCNVRLGFSGGPVFAASDGQLLALTIGKLSMDGSANTVNFALPSTEFVKTIVKYIDTNDVKTLNDLESKCTLKKRIWNNGIPNLNICRI